MIKLVVDSNIIFSAILNTDSRIGQILLTGGDFYEFYAPKYVRNEIWEHQEKIKKIGKFEDEEFFEIYELILKNVLILDHAIVPKNIFLNAFEICKDIDPEDSVFVAFSIFLQCRLWTGDKRLLKGLNSKGLKQTISTGELFEDLSKRNSR